MATGTITEKSAGGKTLQTFVQTSAANTQITTSTGTIGVRNLRMITIKYSGAASVTATVTLNAQAGAGYDTLLQNIVFSSATDGVYLPAYPIPLMDGDAIDVVTPAVASQTSAVSIYTEKQ